MRINDGVHTIILNNRGENPDEVPKELVNFLQYTKKTLTESEQESEDDYIRQLQESIRKIKSSTEMGEKYMQLQEMLQEERAEGRAEGEDLMAKLISLLLEKGLFDEAQEAATDKSVREELYKKYNLL